MAKAAVVVLMGGLAELVSAPSSAEAVHDCGLAPLLGTGLPAASLGRLPTRWRGEGCWPPTLWLPGTVFAPPPTRIVPAGHVAVVVTIPLAPNGPWTVLTLTIVDRAPPPPPQMAKT